MSNSKTTGDDSGRPPTGDDTSRPTRGDQAAEAQPKPGVGEDYSDDEDVREQLTKLFDKVKKAYVDKQEQIDDLAKAWNIYNCELDWNQAYNGNSQVYLPIVADAVDTRADRFCNALFPVNDRYVGALSESGEAPHHTQALLNHYVKAAHLRQLVPALSRCGDIEGQYSIGVGWRARDRSTTVTEGVKFKTGFGTEVEGTEEVQDIERAVKDARPEIFLIPAVDLVILPSTCSNIDDAEVVAIKLRLTPDRIDELIEEGHFTESAEVLVDNPESYREEAGQESPVKQTVEQAGVSANRAQKEALIYQVWSKLDLPAGKGRRWCVSHMAGTDDYIGCKRNPFRNDRVPVITAARIQQRNSIWGRSAITHKVSKLQYAANDAINLGFDSAQYSLQPAIAVDPQKGARIGSVVMSTMALWEIPPDSFKIVTIPDKFKEGFAIAMSCEDRINKSMKVVGAMNPARDKKPTQAQIAQETQAEMQIVSAETEIIEEGILTPMLQWFWDLDDQFRDDEILVRAYGTMGIAAKLERVPPIQHAAQTHQFYWLGTEQTRSMQAMQAKISAANVLQNVPPQTLNGRKLDLVPVWEDLVQTVFGPEIAPKIFIDQRDQMTIDPEVENELLAENLPIEPRPDDDDAKHIQAHMKVMKQDQSGMVKMHIAEHAKAMKMKQMAAQQQQQGQQGGPSGQPRPGAMNKAPRTQGPPGMQHQDQVSDASRTPRPRRVQ